MKVLFDHNIPAGLRNLLVDHVVLTAYELGWSALQNGQLIAVAEAASFDVLVTADQGIFYQQNSAKRKIALIVLSTNRRRLLEAQPDLLCASVLRAQPGSYEFVEIPNPAQN